MVALPVPVPYTYNPGDILGAALLNAQVRDGLLFLLNPPYLELAQAPSTTSIPNNAWTAVTFTDSAGILADPYGGFSFSANTRYTAQAAGWYDVGGVATLASNATGARGAGIYKNGSAVVGHSLVAPTVSGFNCAIATPRRHIQLAVGDYVELRAYQSSGGSLSTVVSSDQTSSLSLRWVHA